ncbi:MAG: hypothetical protein NZ929_06570, partial [Aigarchaeota archaeon]|nr:hypothetical protein [Aigarchaeota archaeon]
YFVNYVECEWLVEKNDGRVSVQVLNSENETISSVYDAYDTRQVTIPRWPIAYAGLTYRNASRFSAVNATVSDKRFGTLNEWCLKMVPNTIGQDGKIIYPSHSMKGLELGLSQFKYMRLYLLGEHTDNFTVDVELIGEEASFSYSFSASFSRNTVRKKRTGKINVRKNVWGKYETVLSTFQGDDISKIERIVITSKYPLLIDSDFVFLSFLREVLKLKFALSRSSPSMNSPTVKLVKIIWREGGVSWSE